MWICTNDLYSSSPLTLSFFCVVRQKLRGFFQNVSMERYGEPLSDDANTMVWSFAVAVFSVGGMIGSLSVGAIVNKFGRLEQKE